MRFQESQDLRVLRRLCELPAFGRLAGVGQTVALSACDHLIAEALLSDFEQARSYVASMLEHDGDKAHGRKCVQDFVEKVEALLSLSPRDLIPRAWRGGGEGMELARRISKLHAAIEASPVFQNWPEGVPAAFARAVRAESDFALSQSGDVELLGWLESPWIEAERLAVCGCAEGLLPTRVDGHAFLPDSVRQALGIAHNASRYARDAYLLHALLASKSAGDLRFSFSRFDQEGSPALPSSLLLRCPPADLPARVLKTFGEIPAPPKPPLRINSWRWSLPADLRQSVVKMSPTDFREYLACPFRFYLKKVLRLEEFDPNAREMDALSFGSIIHSALETFGKENPLESDAAKIERQILTNLEAVVLEKFGAKVSPAVRIQVEAAKVRLRAFAQVQAAEFAKGWRIVSVERKLEADEKLAIGLLHLSGKIDRIERNELTGAWRVMDYKTYAQSKTPAKSHFGPPSAVDWLPSAQLQIGGKSKSWIDLQLPLYLQILSHWHGADLRETPPSTAYFILSADPAETSIQEFVELDSAVQNSAIACVEDIASRVSRGRMRRAAGMIPSKSFSQTGNRKTASIPIRFDFWRANDEERNAHCECWEWENPCANDARDPASGTGRGTTKNRGPHIHSQSRRGTSRQHIHKIGQGGGRSSGVERPSESEWPRRSRFREMPFIARRIGHTNRRVGDGNDR